MKKYVLVLMGLYAGVLFSQTTYYIDFSAGNDANTGTSTSQPFKTLAQVNALNLQPGDSVLFKRGEEWRDQLLPKSGNSAARIYYGAYGSGHQPLIMGSQSKNQQSDWQLISGNFWRCTATFPADIGNIIFDHEASVGVKKWSQFDLNQQDDFYYNLSTGEVIIYSVQNPALIHNVIELAIRRHVIDYTNTSYATFENLDLRYGAAHGFGGSNTAFIEIRNCEISFMGGGDLKMDGSHVRFGNGIEFWSWAHDNMVEKCTLHDIYDTGLTNQNHTNTVIQRNITYRYNVIWNCGMAALEIWNRPSTSITKNIRFENNTCYNNGMGWGTQRPDYSGAGCIFWNNESVTDSVFIRNNIFSMNNRTVYFFENAWGPTNVTINHNLVYNASLTDTVYWVYGTTVFTGNNYAAYQATGHDVNGIYADPLLADVNTGNFQLTSSSPCMDAGEDLGPGTDHDGNPLPVGAHTDIGAYEYFTGMNVEPEDPSWEALQVFPNPASDHGWIELYMREETECSGYISDMSGRILRQFSGWRVVPGKNTFSMEVSYLAPGIYILVVSKGAVSYTARFIKK